MNLIKSSLLLTIFCAVLSTQSCTDKCDDIVCENGGNCIDDACECPEGFLGDFCEQFDISQIQALLDVDTITPKILYDAGVPLDSLYGKMYEGGFIFYLDTVDGTGMVAASVDQSDGAEWGCLGTVINGADGEALGTGGENTMAILDGCTQLNFAAKLCSNLVLNDKSDWFLPSRGELNSMYTNLQENGHGGFNGSFYWSSSENSVNFAWFHTFNNGIQATRRKDDDLRINVRAARAF